MSSKPKPAIAVAASPPPPYQITPPTSCLNGPPTPPQSEATPPSETTPPSEATPPQSEERLGINALRIITIVQHVQRGKGLPIRETTLFQLAEGEYDEIGRRVRRLGYEDALGAIRYDYNARTYLFVMVKPSMRHECFLAELAFNIRFQVKTIAQGSDKAAAFARDIISTRSAKDEYSEPGLSEKSVHSPDDQFGHRKDRRPSVIIEVADSQPWKKLNEMAPSYLSAEVKALVGVDFEYGPRATRRATLSIWRLQTDYAAKTGRVITAPNQEAFRDQHGKPTDSPGLRLRLSDFASKQLSQALLGDDDRDIVVSTECLCQILDVAEEQEAMRKESLAQGSGDAGGITIIVSDSSSSFDSETSSDEAEEEFDSDPDWDTEAMRGGDPDPNRVLRSRGGGMRRLRL